MRRSAPATLFIVVALTSIVPIASEEAKAPSEEARLLELGRPGPDHAALGALEGTWSGSVSYVPYPGAAPIPSEATAERTWVLGGRYLRTAFSSTVQDEAFEAIGFIGFDRVADRYVSMWMDSMSTQVLALTGDCSADCRELTVEGERYDPQTERRYRVRQVTRIESDDRHTTEFYDQLDDGTMFKSLEIRWQRR